jgi:hypothetical protein
MVEDSTCLPVAVSVFADHRAEHRGGRLAFANRQLFVFANSELIEVKRHDPDALRHAADASVLSPQRLACRITEAAVQPPITLVVSDVMQFRPLLVDLKQRLLERVINGHAPTTSLGPSTQHPVQVPAEPVGVQPNEVLVGPFDGIACRQRHSYVLAGRTESGTEYGVTVCLRNSFAKHNYSREGVYSIVATQNVEVCPVACVSCIRRRKPLRRHGAPRRRDCHLSPRRPPLRECVHDPYPQRDCASLRPSGFGPAAYDAERGWDICGHDRQNQQGDLRRRPRGIRIYRNREH